MGVVEVQGEAYSAEMKEPVVTRDPEIMSGAPVFSGTRVPVQHLLDYLKSGETVDEFLDGFPSVRREQVEAFLQQAGDLLVESAA